MIPNAWAGFDFGLGSDVDMLREIGERLRAGPHRAARRRDRPRQCISPRPVAGNGRARPASASPSRKNTAAPGSAISRIAWRWRKSRAPAPRSGLSYGAHSNLCVNQIRRNGSAAAEAQISAQADFRRACRRAGDVGAGRRLRRRVDAHARRQERRPLRAQRLEDVDHQRAGRRHVGDLCQDRPHRRRARHHRLHRRKGLQGFCARAEARQARHARLRHQRTGVHRLRGAGGERAGRGRQRRQHPDVRSRLRARGAGGRPARHHAGLHGRGDPLCARAPAVRSGRSGGSS